METVRIGVTRFRAVKRIGVADSKTCRSLVMTNARSSAPAPCIADDLTGLIIGLWPGRCELQDAEIAALHFHMRRVRASHEDGMQFG